jgi:hypothetical protein
MNRTPLALVAAALLLAVAFFALGLFSDGAPEERAMRPDSTDSFASLPAGSRREGFSGERETGAEPRRRLAAADDHPRQRGAVPGRESLRGKGATVVETERHRAGGGRSIDAVDRTQRLRDMARIDDGGDGARPSDLIPEGLRGRPDLNLSGDVATDNTADPQPGDANSAPEGKIFDPFSVYDGERSPDEQPYLVEKVDFLDGEHGVDMGDDSVLTFPAQGNVSGEAGTIHFEIDPDWDGTEESTRTLLRIDEPGQWNNRLRLVKDNNYLRYMFFDNTGAEVNINTPIDGWQAGDPHELTVNWDQQAGKISMYIDGELMAEQPYAGELVLDAKSRLDLGSKGGDGYIGAGGRITNLTAYDRALTPFDF